MQQPLEGIRVLDCSRLLPGPFATQILRDLGAEVIKVEDPHGGDYIRYDPPTLSDGNSAAFHALNRGKKSIVLDLKKANDLDVFIKLIAQSHVLLESFRPGVMRRLGLDPHQLIKQFPHLIVCSISGYGQTGPGAQQAGHDLNYLARAGVLAMSKSPTPLPVQVADICGGAMPAVIQILAALRRAERTGQGSYIDVSMTDAAHSLLVMPMARHAALKEEIGKGRDILVGSVPCYYVYPTADGFISVGALEPKFWKRLIKALKVPELESQQFAQDADGEQVKAKLAHLFKQHNNQYWSQFFAQHDCAVEVVLQPESAAQQDAQLQSRQLYLPVQVEDNKTLMLLKTPLNMTGIQFAQTPGPKLGAHNEEILKQLEKSTTTSPTSTKLQSKL